MLYLSRKNRRRMVNYPVTDFPLRERALSAGGGNAAWEKLKSKVLKLTFLAGEQHPEEKCQISQEKEDTEKIVFPAWDR